MLELTTQSRKRKIKDNDLLGLYKPYKKRKTDEDNEDIEHGATLSSNFVSHLVSSKKENPALLIKYEIRNGGKVSTVGGQEKTLKRICQLQEQHLT